ncbi:MAG: alpha/beta hydrolase [Myxococcota bacterium]
MGSSVGAASILIALPGMPRLAGVIAENPMFSFQRLITESPAAPEGVPRWFNELLLGITMQRGAFDGLLSPASSLRLCNTTPVFFIHSKHDNVVPYQQTQELAQLYPGPKTVWLAEDGNHGSIWDVDHGAYEKRLADFLDAARRSREATVTTMNPKEKP